MVNCSRSISSGSSSNELAMSWRRLGPRSFALQPQSD